MNEFSVAFLAGLSYGLIAMWFTTAVFAGLTWWATKHRTPRPWYALFAVQAANGLFLVVLETQWVMAGGWAAIGAMPNIKWSLAEAGLGLSEIAWNIRYAKTVLGRT